MRMNLEMKDEFVRKSHAMLEQKHEYFVKKFDEFFETITKDRKRIEKQ